jgi:hypothetical protein
MYLFSNGRRQSHDSWEFIDGKIHITEYMAERIKREQSFAENIYDAVDSLINYFKKK